MSDHADKSSEQRRIVRLSELLTLQFISDALRAGRRAILVTGRGQASTRVPEAALTASGSASARTLHIGPPLPEPPELQEMIGSAVGVAGGREMTPQAMAQQLRLADPRPSVILAIDDAHTLSHQSLGYLTLMTELLASEAPILQIVLSANPSLLDTLAQPEFEGLLNRLSRPLFETIQTLPGKRADGAYLGLRKATHGGATTLFGHAQNGGPAELSRGGYGFARAVRTAVALLAASGLAAIGYIALGLTPAPIPLNSDAPQKFLPPSGPSESLEQLGPGQFGETIDPLIDQTVDAVASGSVALTSTLLERIAKLDSGALLPALEDRLAARMSAAEADGRTDEARRMEQAYFLAYSAGVLAYSAAGRRDPLTVSNQRSFQSPRTAIPSPSSTGIIGGRPQQRETAQEPGVPPSGSAVSAEQPGASGDRDRAPLSPNTAAPAPPSAVADRNVDEAPPPLGANSTPLDISSTLSAEQRGAAGDRDRAPLSSNAAAPAPPSPIAEQNVDEAPPPIGANSTPLDISSTLSAEQPGAAGDRDRAPLSSNAAAPTPPSAVAERNVDEVPPPIGANSAPLDSSSSLSAQQPGAAGDRDRAPLSSKVAAPTPPSTFAERNVDRPPPAMLAEAAPTTPGDHEAQVAVALPALAPVRVVLNVARGGLSHAADIQHALVAAGVQTDLVPVDVRRPTPSIGYYFQSDRNVAVGVSHLLAPLLGAVDPVALRIRGSTPEPGTIEIAVP
jgi:hypothetical protein